MQAVILAAGVGQRLGDMAGDRPKSLLQFGGLSLLGRHLLNLEYYGVTRITVVTGYQAERIEQELAVHGRSLDIRTRLNPDYRRGSVVSLHAAADILDDGQTVLLMDADVLYQHDLIGRLLASPHENCFLLDRDFEAGEEPVKLCVRNGRLIDFRKRIDKNLQFDFQGESVGFFRFAPDMAAGIAKTCGRYLGAGRRDDPYEEVIRDELLTDPGAFGYEDVTGTPWIEIDFPADVRLAEQKILPQITLPDDASQAW